jgi:spore germination protein
VKINLSSGTVIGYDATSYFTNHVDRSLSKGKVKTSEVSGKVPSYFDLVQSRVVLSPLDYNREVVCIEIEARDSEDTYYFYFNASDGELENVLKVIKTDNGNLLM